MVDGDDAYAIAFDQLKALAQTDFTIAAYLTREQEELSRRRVAAQETDEIKTARRERVSAEIMAQFPLDELIAAARRHDRSKGRFMRFGLWSDNELRIKVLEQLNVELDIEACLRLLWVFRNATPPYLPERLWAFADHEDVRLRDAALTALSHSDEPAVGEFGWRYLGRGNFSCDDSVAIELFARHYRAGDEVLIMQVLNTLHPNETEAHGVGTSIRAFCKRNNSAATAGILNWLYRTNPCTICRRQAVELLIETDCLLPEFAMECRFDASAAIRALVK